MIRRPPRSTHCISSAASDVYKRQIIHGLFLAQNQIKDLFIIKAFTLLQLLMDIQALFGKQVQIMEYRITEQDSLILLFYQNQKLQRINEILLLGVMAVIYIRKQQKIELEIYGKSNLFYWYYDARANIMWAGTIAHNGTCGVGREEDWATHLLEHELSALCNVTHGAGLAVVFPAWMIYLADFNPDMLAQYAVRVQGIPDSDDKKAVALKGVEALKKFFSSIGLPVSFKELGAREEDIDLLVKRLHDNKGETVGFFKKLSREDSLNIYQIAARQIQLYLLD
eukprot:TRINITY_DN4130_c0_g2_i1.p1 TRINITY_DN4130_c0_g2~~TRINITY_DN4130_c0_g2_i1.p1  ORF type:complete len:282 (+),score=48.78 TRINITY_DN4130_c0_g2_i1:133-978(+)